MRRFGARISEQCAPLNSLRPRQQIAGHSRAWVAPGPRKAGERAAEREGQSAHLAARRPAQSVAGGQLSPARNRRFNEN